MVHNNLSDPQCQRCIIAMNLSGRTLGAVDVDDFFRKKLLESRVHPHRIVFEVTETAAISEMTKARSFITTMKKLGHRFSLDDFGVGFASFSYLKHLSVNSIKIDGSFIRHLETSREDQIFVRAIVQVARELGLETVAECVENKEGLEILREMGVGYAQGYYVAAPSTEMILTNIELARRSAYKRSGNSAP